MPTIVRRHHRSSTYWERTSAVLNTLGVDTFIFKGEKDSRKFPDRRYRIARSKQGRSHCNTSAVYHRSFKHINLSSGLIITRIFHRIPKIDYHFRQTGVKINPLTKQPRTCIGSDLPRYSSSTKFPASCPGLGDSRKPRLRCALTAVRGDCLDMGSRRAYLWSWST